MSLMTWLMHEVQKYMGVHVDKTCPLTDWTDMTGLNILNTNLDLINLY